MFTFIAFCPTIINTQELRQSNQKVKYICMIAYVMTASSH